MTIKVVWFCFFRLRHSLGTFLFARFNRSCVINFLCVVILCNKCCAGPRKNKSLRFFSRELRITIISTWYGTSFFVILDARHADSIFIYICWFIYQVILYIIVSQFDTTNYFKGIAQLFGVVCFGYIQVCFATIASRYDNATICWT